MLPTTISIFGNFFLIDNKTLETPLEWAWAVSITRASTFDSTRASALFSLSLLTPKAAATTRRPYLSLFEFGFVKCLVTSLKVISPTKLLFLSTTGSFSILCFCKISSASFNDVPLLTVIKFLTVITSLIGRDLLFSKRKSLFVTIPSNFLFESTIGIPPILFCNILSFASPTLESSYRTTGSIIIPDSDRLTFLIFSTCSFIVIFLCITPIPPSLAIAIAMLLSVTVSIAAETIGMLSEMFLEKREITETSLGRTSEYLGTNRTSS